MVRDQATAGRFAPASVTRRRSTRGLPTFTSWGATPAPPSRPDSSWCCWKPRGLPSSRRWKN